MQAFIINDLSAPTPALEPLPAVPDTSCNTSTANVYGAYAAVCVATGRDLAIMPAMRPTSAVIAWLTDNDISEASDLASWAAARSLLFLLVSDLGAQGDLVVITRQEENASGVQDTFPALLDILRAIRRLAAARRRAG